MPSDVPGYSFDSSTQRPAGRVIAYDADTHLPIIQRITPEPEGATVPPLAVRAEDLPPQTATAGLMSPEAEAASAKAATTAPENQTAQPALPVNSTQLGLDLSAGLVPKVQSVGEEDPASGSMVLQPTSDPKEAQRLATAEFPSTVDKVMGAIDDIPGASIYATRPEKSTARVQDKINDEEQPAHTLPDYSALQVSVKSPEARDQAVSAIKQVMPICQRRRSFRPRRQGLRLPRPQTSGPAT